MNNLINWFKFIFKGLGFGEYSWIGFKIGIGICFLFNFKCSRKGDLNGGK